MDATAYVRISLDKTGLAAGVERQLEDCRELCARRGWTLTEVYRDNDLSAYSGKRRPEFERLLTDIAEGRAQAVVCWHPDRLYRRGKDLQRFVDVVQAAKIPVATVTAGDIDLTTPTGRMQAKIIGAVSEQESEHKAERQRRAFQQMREEGRPHGGGRMYGYTAKGKKVIPEEAEIIRELARRILAGESAYSIAKDLNARAVATARGNRWHDTSIKELLRLARLSGRVERTYDADRKRLCGECGGSMVKDKGGVEHCERDKSHRRRGRMGRIVGPGQWEAILSVEDSDRLRAMLAPIPSGQTGRRPERLLTGIATCGLCGSPLSSGYMGRGGGGRRLMLCKKADWNGRVGGCGGIGVTAEPVEVLVEESVLSWIEGAGGLNALLDDPDTTAIDELAKIEEKLTELGLDYRVRDLIGRREYEAALAPLNARQRELERRLQLSRARVGLEGLPDPIRPGWEVLTLGQKRAVIKATTESIVIVPATKPYNRSRPADRVRITWRKRTAA